MPRVKHHDVTAIIDTDIEDVLPFITAANQIVTDKLGDVDSLTDDQRTEIERWLSAHFVACKDRLPTEEKIGDATVKYGGTLGKGLEATIYGQQVMVLDTSGVLASTGKRQAQVKVIG